VERSERSFPEAEASVALESLPVEEEDEVFEEPAVEGVVEEVGDVVEEAPVEEELLLPDDEPDSEPLPLACVAEEADAEF
jgi:hypothetical protein